jgi:hypothetical protein
MDKGLAGQMGLAPPLLHRPPIRNEDMAGGRLERRMEAAKQLEQTLSDKGLCQYANVIRDLRLSARSVQSTLKTVHRDNMKLRQQLGLPSFLDEQT